MNKPEEPHHLAKVRQTNALISTVWIIPVLAAIIGIWLLIQNYREKGPEITLLLDNA